MMKKNGFTLAEVLITLTIIGVIATMTLPSLMTNTQEQQAKTGLKKAINTLSEAVAMNEATDNFDYSTLGEKGYGDMSKDSTDAENAQSLAYILHNRVAVDYAKTDGSYKIKTVDDFKDSQSVILRDGAAILIPKTGTALPTDWNVLNEDDNLPNGFVVIYDYNGLKAPNILSNCNGKAAGELEAPEVGDLTYTVCGEKGKRVIKDQFALRLRGTVVQPEGPAANWAFNN